LLVLVLLPNQSSIINHQSLIMDVYPVKIKDINAIIQWVESGADINKKYGQFHETVLHIAARGGLLNIVQYLISKGADVNTLDRYNNTPLHDVAYTGRIEIAKCLLENGADKLAINDGDRTPQQTATYYKNDDLAEFIESFESIPTKGVYL